MTPGKSENMEDERRSFMERLLFRKVELWFVGLLVTVMLGLTVLFGAVVRNQLLGHDKFGAAGVVALKVAEIPSTIRKMTKQKDRMTAVDGGVRFFGRSGWSAPGDTTGLDGYLLLSRVDGDADQQHIELVDLRNFEIVHTWNPDANDLFADIPICAYCSEKISNKTFRPVHPLVFQNGDLLVKNHNSPLARIDVCSRKVWVNPTIFHHSNNIDENGDIWSPGYLSEPEAKANKSRGEGYYNEAIYKISPEGETLAKFDLTKILERSGYKYLLAGMNEDYHADPLHLNDVQPVMKDGKFWKAGDIFLSMRNKSTVALFRPSAGKIVWLKSGPWIVQHDVDIISDSQIYIFDNHLHPDVVKTHPNDFNRIAVYDFSKDSVNYLWQDKFKKYEIKTDTEGLYDLLPNGYVMIEETNFGRIVIFSSDGVLAAEYINGGSDGRSYMLNWSRYVSRVLGDKVKNAAKSAACGN